MVASESLMLTMALLYGRAYQWLKGTLTGPEQQVMAVHNSFPSLHFIIFKKILQKRVKAFAHMPG